MNQYQIIHEKIAQKSRSEIERITFLLDKYSKGCNFTFIDGLSYLMGECGYRKMNYNPCSNKEDLFIITQLSLKYMKIYIKVHINNLVFMIIIIIEF
jgi:hypothetical protein